MQITNIQTSSAYPGKGVTVKVDVTDPVNAEFISWFYPGMQFTTTSGKAGQIATIDRANGSFVVSPAQPDQCFGGDVEPYKLKAGEAIYFNENKIGNLIWKLTNENFTSFANGDYIPYVGPNVLWAGLTSPGFCYYNNDGSNYFKYGYLYNYFTLIDPRGLPIPKGWRIPTPEDLIELVSLEATSVTETLIGYNIYSGAGAYKSLSPNWNIPNIGASNAYEMAIEPGGYRNSNGTFASVNYRTYLWANSVSPYTLSRYNQPTANNQTVALRFFSSSADAILFFNTFKKQGFSIRLCRDIQEDVVITKAATGI